MNSTAFRKLKFAQRTINFLDKTNTGFHFSLTGSLSRNLENNPNDIDILITPTRYLDNSTVKPNVLTSVPDDKLWELLINRWAENLKANIESVVDKNTVKEVKLRSTETHYLVHLILPK